MMCDDNIENSTVLMRKNYGEEIHHATHHSVFLIEEEKHISKVAENCTITFFLSVSSPSKLLCICLVNS
jgi:hypothetical protein